MKHLLVAILLTTGALRAQAPAAQPTPRELFLKNCAQCHGENGDGNGVQKLDKPARSFKDGGFSYGNTPEALLRTITFGIPGTPMPSFATALTDAQKKDLAAYVITLGPEVVKVEASETRLVVKDAPLFVRGKLPPIVDGAKETVRGLLVGTPDGFTFEYDVDDVRLLGVRQGDFVERRDWGGRGGDALQPLGKLVYDTGARGGSAFECSGAPLRAFFVSSRARGAEAHLASRLVAADGRTFARVDESASAASSALGAGFTRRVRIDAELDGALDFALSSSAGATIVARSSTGCARRRADGVVELTHLRAASGRAKLLAEDARVVVRVALERGSAVDVEATVVLAPAWTPELETAWNAELSR